MCRVKYFINRREPDAVALADQMRLAGIDFSSLPTSGPMMLWIDGRASYGPTAVRYAVRKLVEAVEAAKKPYLVLLDELFVKSRNADGKERHMTEYEWKFKPDAPQQGSSDGFWYDIGDGGYIDPAKVLADPEQVAKVTDAVKLLESFADAMEAADLIIEF